MKVVVAPDSYKECLPAREVAAAMAEAVLAACPSAEVIQIPLADGGEGTMDVLAEALGATFIEADVSDPLGRIITTRFAAVGQTGIIEVSQACGLSLLKLSERNPLIASSKGAGELIMAAYHNGCRHLIIGIGGSATCDGGAGMLSVPGIKEALKSITVELLCDVDNPFVGLEGAARVFAPQKGASPSGVEILERRMELLASQMKEETGIDVSQAPGAGAAGGIGGALMAYVQATYASGIDKVMQLVGFDSAAKDADLIITGEGRSDMQTLKGKVPFGVLRHSKGKTVALISGAIDESARQSLAAAGFQAIHAATPPGVPLDVAMTPSIAIANIRSAVEAAIKTLQQ